ncbi:MAG: ergothioneine biosynthesis glutamate--cysteine ligase EgtA [Acidimicrobiaceae bacterium]|nr:ergothioneine biosynthesis glutamate--cysteine ligase EgtA [Acidimicrobiaceae bacterium]MYA73636.1 ergothioneine biosynthesis glutamate--cysteine ligase EgtA [Acidimicrobiaceae bacterium]MYD06555.1 ergothioneine biosynthesis glutamate--cysteine ligase EgtA [Acidimicrobiaceae bacterium]MYG55760.1 ergothioneine biosynthesis glutamate--cysteine ligase EgtA [Acidimicrobiaceae bacterium]MYI57470.1 ergothioneine biosynthesis glutamate--cysteine ligase EgtA [Acidimicrobiaceae bacterium]
MLSRNGASPTRLDVEKLAAAAFEATAHNRIGAEVEWLVFAADDLERSIPAARVAEVASGPLPARSSVTIEPGGQLELITRPFDDPLQLLDAITADAQVLRTRFAEQKLLLVALGLDPFRPPVRTLKQPRYEAMEQFFAARSPTGLKMMNLTASLQLNIDLGPDPERSWRRAQVIAPVLSAAFANSPTIDGSTFAAVSHRQRVWASTAPSRGLPVPPGTDAWSEYILDSQVMLRITADGVHPQLDDLSLRQWQNSDSPPTSEELALHISTLFPPLRPRGYLEMRMIDALGPKGRSVAVGASWVLLANDQAGAHAEAVCSKISDRWKRATAAGLEDPEVADAAHSVLTIAADALRVRFPSLAKACVSWRDERLNDRDWPTDRADLVRRSIEY